LDAGIVVERGTSTDSALNWNESTDKWEQNRGGTSSVIPVNTTELPEGANLYYTDTRADSRMEYQESLRQEIERSLSTLTDRQKDVIKLYFGIGVEHPMSLEDIGEKFALTRERVRQIKDKAINKLRGTSRSKLLRSYLGG
jgi:RNA polymerase sigma factor (sigma-70 family)